MNKKQAVKSINKIGNIGYVIAKICRIFMMVGVIGSIVGAIIMFALPNDLFKLEISGGGTVTVDVEAAGESPIPVDIRDIRSGEMTLDLNGDKYVGVEPVISEDGKTITIAVTGGNKYISPDRVAVILLFTTVYLTVCFVVAVFIEKLCKALKTAESPFSESITVSMERFGWALIPWAVVHSAFESIMEQSFSETIDIRAGFSLSVVLAVLLIFGLVKIFKYGAVLQQEADETL